MLSRFLIAFLFVITVSGPSRATVFFNGTVKVGTVGTQYLYMLPSDKAVREIISSGTYVYTVDPTVPLKCRWGTTGGVGTNVYECAQDCGNTYMDLVVVQGVNYALHLWCQVVWDAAKECYKATQGGCPITLYATNDSYNPTTTDTDGDGQEDAYDPAPNDGSMTSTTDTDLDGVPDWIDPDKDTPGNYIGYQIKRAIDYNGDGRPDYLEIRLMRADGTFDTVTWQNKVQESDNIRPREYWGAGDEIDGTITDYNNSMYSLQTGQNATLTPDMPTNTDSNDPGVWSEVDDDVGDLDSPVDSSASTTDHELYRDIVESNNRVGDRIDKLDQHNQNSLKHIDESIRNLNQTLKNKDFGGGGDVTTGDINVDVSGVESRIDETNDLLDGLINDDTGAVVPGDNADSLVSGWQSDVDNALNLDGLRDGTDSDIPVDYRTFTDLPGAIDGTGVLTTITNYLSGLIDIQLSGASSTFSYSYRGSNISFDFSQYSSILDLMGQILFGLCCLEAVWIVFRK